MLNLALGSARPVDGGTCIVTGDKAGHAIYGPYEVLEPGRYTVAFHLSLLSGDQPRGDGLCAVLDVAADTGRSILVSKRLFQSQLANRRESFAVEFTLSKSTRVEYRVWVSGRVPLLVEEHRRAIPVPADACDLAPYLASGAFPLVDENSPSFLRDNAALLRGLYEQHMGVSVFEGGVVLTVQGVSLHARSLDDLNFVGEIFQQRAYNLSVGRPIAVIDVGMNIGLTSLMLATKPEIMEIHAFEPFSDTFARAQDNFSLNPLLAGKIEAHNIGLSNKDWSGTMNVGGGADSGSRSTIAASEGPPIYLVLKDAGGVLRPVIEGAEAKGLGVIVKLDCEGSEFAIMQSLVDAGLIGRIDAFMVEWHAMFSEHSQETLLAPLRANGFLIFDQSPPTGNGFFYAVRMADTRR